MGTLYNRYFQKSKTFLYPLLQISKKADEVQDSVETFLHVENLNDDLDFIHSLVNPTIAVRFKVSEKLDLVGRRREMLRLYTSLISNVHVLQRYYHKDMLDMVVIFNVFDMQEDYDLVVAGQYSKLSELAKLRIQRYYGVHTPHWVQVQKFLYPENYYQEYADQLQIDIKDLQNKKQLAEMPDLAKETLRLDLEIYKSTLIL